MPLLETCLRCPDFLRATNERRNSQEVPGRGKTIAEALREEGFLVGYAEGFARGFLMGKRETLLRLLRQKFKRVSPAITAEIESAQDSQQLDAWASAFATAEKISDIPFQANKKK